MAKKSNRGKKNSISKPAKIVIIVFAFLISCTAAVGLYWHWDDITGHNNGGYSIEVDPDHIYF